MSYTDLNDFNEKMDKYYKRINTFNYTVIFDKYNVNILFKKLRYINYRGLFVTGIPHYVDFEQLKEFEYFGQYGKISNIFKYSKEKKDRLYYSIFIEYNNKLSAFLAIYSISNFSFDGRKKVNVSNSTNKVCKFDFFDNYCTNTNCIYYHGEVNENNSIVKFLEYTNIKIIRILQNNTVKYLMKNKQKLAEFKNEGRHRPTMFPNVYFAIDAIMLS